MQCALPHGTRPGLVLAGGLSRRMGESKADLSFDGSSLLAFVSRRLAAQVSDLAINSDSASATELALPVVPDIIPDHAGPLSGVLAGLRHFSSLCPAATHMITVPVDGPFFPADLGARLMELADTDGIAIASSAGRSHPVFAAWPFSLADDLEAWLSDPQNRRLTSFLARHPHREVAFALIDTPARPVDPFFNINTPADMAEAVSLLDAIR
ncbi:molybdenum cofactor guanylyltransferase MobA [Rhizobium sp. PAMB 3174]